MSASGEERVALIAAVAGCGVAVAAWRDPWVLLSGLAVGVGGVLLALRPPPPEPAHGSSWPGALLALALCAQIAFFALRFAEGWTLGELLSEGAGEAQLALAGRRIAHWSALCRLVADGSAAAFLLLAAWRKRVASPPSDGDSAGDR